MPRSYKYFVSKLYNTNVLLWIINYQLQIIILYNILSVNQIGRQFYKISKSG